MNSTRVVVNGSIRNCKVYKEFKHLKKPVMVTDIHLKEPKPKEASILKDVMFNPPLPASSPFIIWQFLIFKSKKGSNNSVHWTGRVIIPSVKFFDLMTLYKVIYEVSEKDSEKLEKEFEEAYKRIHYPEEKVKDLEIDVGNRISSLMMDAEIPIDCHIYFKENTSYITHVYNIDNKIITDSCVVSGKLSSTSSNIRKLTSGLFDSPELMRCRYLDDSGDVGDVCIKKEQKQLMSFFTLMKRDPFRFIFDPRFNVNIELYIDMINTDLLLVDFSQEDINRRTPLSQTEKDDIFGKLISPREQMKKLSDTLEGEREVMRDLITECQGKDYIDIPMSWADDQIKVREREVVEKLQSEYKVLCRVAPKEEDMNRFTTKNTISSIEELKTKISLLNDTRKPSAIHARAKRPVFVERDKNMINTLKKHFGIEMKEKNTDKKENAIETPKPESEPWIFIIASSTEKICEVKAYDLMKNNRRVIFSAFTKNELDISKKVVVEKLDNPYILPVMARYWLECPMLFLIWDLDECNLSDLSEYFVPQFSHVDRVHMFIGICNPERRRDDITRNIQTNTEWFKETLGIKDTEGSQLMVVDL